MSGELVEEIISKLRGIDKDKLYLFDEDIRSFNDKRLALEYLSLGGVDSLSMKDLFCTQIDSDSDQYLAIEYGMRDGFSSFSMDDLDRLEEKIVSGGNRENLSLYLNNCFGSDDLFRRVALLKDNSLLNEYILADFRKEYNDADSYLWSLIDIYLNEYKKIRKGNVLKRRESAGSSFRVMSEFVRKNADDLVGSLEVIRMILFGLATGGMIDSKDIQVETLPVEIVRFLSNYSNQPVYRDFFLSILDNDEDLSFKGDLSFNKEILLEILKKLYDSGYEIMDINKLNDSYFVNTEMEFIYNDFFTNYVPVLRVFKRVKKGLQG